MNFYCCVSTFLLILLASLSQAQYVYNYRSQLPTANQEFIRRNRQLFEGQSQPQPQAPPRFAMPAPTQSVAERINQYHRMIAEQQAAKEAAQQWQQQRQRGVQGYRRP